jgi:hypothetical protein
MCLHFIVSFFTPLSCFRIKSPLVYEEIQFILSALEVLLNSLLAFKYCRKLFLFLFLLKRNISVIILAHLFKSFSFFLRSSSRTNDIVSPELNSKYLSTLLIVKAWRNWPTKERQIPCQRPVTVVG